MIAHVYGCVLSMHEGACECVWDGDWRHMHWRAYSSDLLRTRTLTQDVQMRVHVHIQDDGVRVFVEVKRDVCGYSRTR